MDHLSSSQQEFILHWGEMGTRWGVNRMVAQIHALLYLSPQPVHSEEIANTLAVARSNVSTSLKELQNWGLIRVTHVMGDRRDHFESLKDVWEMYRVLLEERKRRELNPTLEMLHELMDELEKGGDEEAYTRDRIKDITRFLEGVLSWFEEVRSLPKETILKLMKLGMKIQKVLSR